MNDFQQQHRNRLTQILRLVAREDEHLLAVHQRLFGTVGNLSQEWIKTLQASPQGIDRLESFGAKFGRMQDTIVDKLLPQLLRTAGEKPGTAIDNLNRVEKLGLIENTDRWIAMRGLRNLLVHEYIQAPEDMRAALQQAQAFTIELHLAFETIKDYAQRKLNVSL
ncbi:MAG: hypothetical protein GXP17_00850 [Gammaproteobacteria bacterium]|nr:hypothetical protein [Gammaproteobacteria bacterium]